MAEQEWIVVKVSGVMVGQIQRVVRWNNDRGPWCQVDGSHYRVHGGAVLTYIKMPNKPKGMMYDLDDELQSLQDEVEEGRKDFAQDILNLIETAQTTTPKYRKKETPTTIIELVKEECESEIQ